MPIKFTTMMGLPTAVSLFILVFHLSILSSVSKGVSAQIFLPPRVSTPQNTVMVKEGQTKVVLECQLDVGNDPVSYKWFKQYKWVTADLGFAYRTHRKVHLALHTVTRRHEGTYDCMATNEAGTDATTIEVIVVPGEHFHSSQPQDFPDTAIVLSELAASLNDVLAEGNCSCDLMFLLHASPDAHNDTLAAQANFVETIASTIISEEIHAGAATYSDYVNQKLPIGKGTSSCALQEALKDLGHKKWATRIQPVLRDSFKKLKKTKKECKVLFLFIFGSLGTEGANEIVAKHLKKIGVKLFILEVTNSPIKGVQEMASERGDGKPYHWWVPLKIWPTIVSYMSYMPEELVGCMAPPSDVDNVCGGEGTACTLSSQCRGVGFGCVEETCKSLECNVNPDNPECCKTPGDFWCGDVTKSCVSRELMCDGKIQCMNGRDEESCWQIAVACKEGEARCQSSTLCLTMYDLCDGLPHCPSAEDEDPSFCGSFPCPTDRPFRCRNGKCIPTERLCDGTFRDCADGEDEQLQYCSERHVCPSSRPFKCDYGVCVPERMVCDGSYNCLDALDERLCEERNCPPERPFKCSDGKCVDINLVCNGVVDACVDGADEKNCSAFVCPSERSFKCLNGRCIDKWLECDDRDDCGDGTDEMKCEKPAHTTTPLPVPSPIPTEITCQEGEFFCTSGVCLPEKKVCDGHRDCIDNEDEDVELCKDYSCPSYRAFKCWDHVCVDGKFCDGVEDCSSGADEAHCDDESEVETVIEGGESGETRDTGEIKEPEGGEGNEDPSTDLEDAMLVEESGCLSIVASPILLVLTAVLFVSV